MAIEESKEDVLVSQLRGTRPFVIAESDEHIDNAMGQLVKYKAKLKEQNVVIATVDMLNGGGKKKAKKARGRLARRSRLSLLPSGGRGGWRGRIGSGGCGAHGVGKEQAAAAEVAVSAARDREEVARRTPRRGRVAHLDRERD